METPLGILHVYVALKSKKCKTHWCLTVFGNPLPLKPTANIYLNKKQQKVNIYLYLLNLFFYFKQQVEKLIIVEINQHKWVTQKTETRSRQKWEGIAQKADTTALLEETGREQVQGKCLCAARNTTTTTTSMEELLSTVPEQNLSRCLAV